VLFFLQGLWLSRNGAKASVASRSAVERQPKRAPIRPLASRPDPEVVAKPKRRTYTAEYKQRILRRGRAVAATPGGVGALLRREGLYSSLLTYWRRERAKGVLEALTPRPTRAEVQAQSDGRRSSKAASPERRLTEDLRKAHLIIDVQKKVAALLGNPIPEQDPDPRRSPDGAVTELATMSARARLARPCVCRALLTTGIAVRPFSPGGDRVEAFASTRTPPGGTRNGPGCLHEERFQDRSPAAVYATLLDEGSITARFAPCIACSKRRARSRERRDQLTHPALPEARTAGHGSQSTLELGHHQAARPREMDLLLPLRDPRCVQPLRHRLDGRDARKRGVGQETDRGKLRETTHPARSTHPACRSRHLDEFQAGGLLLADIGVTKTHSRPHVSDDNPYSESQFRTLKVSAGVPRPLRMHSGQSRFLSEIFSLVQRRAPSLTSNGCLLEGSGASCANLNSSGIHESVLVQTA
jgi:transposase